MNSIKNLEKRLNALTPKDEHKIAVIDVDDYPSREAADQAAEDMRKDGYNHFIFMIRDD